MSKLDNLLGGDQLDFDALLSEAPAERGDGVSVGDVVTHADYSDFRGRVASVENGKARVTVIRGWLGPVLPCGPVTIPIRKLLAV